MTDESKRETLALIGAGAAGAMIAGIDAFMRNVNWEEVDRRFPARQRAA